MSPTFSWCAVARVRELAVRLAIGATRTRIVLQLFTENALLAIAGGALGVAVAAGAVRLFIALAPPDVPRLDEVHLNAVALASALGITTIAIMLFGLAPAILASRLQLEAALRSDTRQSTTRSRIGAGKRWWRLSSRSRCSCSLVPVLSAGASSTCSEPSFH